MAPDPRGDRLTAVLPEFAASRGGELLPVTINIDGDALIRAFVRVGKRNRWTN